MAGSDCRSLNLPSIPDADLFDFDEKAPLLSIDIDLSGEINTVVGGDSSDHQTKALQFPPGPHSHHDTTFESWTITYHQPVTRTISQYRALGITWWSRTDVEEGYVLSVVANPHFSQGELEATVAEHQAAAAAYHLQSANFQQKGAASQTNNDNSNGLALQYTAGLTQRLRALDWKVQDEIYDLLSDRAQSSSSPFRRWEWRVVVMSAVPGGDMTDAGSEGMGMKAAMDGQGLRTAGGEDQGRSSHCLPFAGIWQRVKTAWRNVKARRREMRRKRRERGLTIVEYRLILRGTETKTSEQGWGVYNRYSRPWKTFDYKEIGEIRAERRLSSIPRTSEKYVVF